MLRARATPSPLAGEGWGEEGLDASLKAGQTLAGKVLETV